MEKCLVCKHYRGIRRGRNYCFAFPHGIPEKVFTGEHLTVLERQRGEYVFTEGTDKRIIIPFPESRMELPKYFGRDNLCSTIRDIYMRTEDPEIKLWARMAVRMAKNMYSALSDYKEMLTEAGYPVGHDSREDWQLRKRSLKVNR